MPAEFTGGLEYNFDELKDEMLGYNRIVDQTVHIGSLFLQNEWKNEKWSFLIGGRFDKHNLIDHLRAVSVLRRRLTKICMWRPSVVKWRLSSLLRT